MGWLVSPKATVQTRKSSSLSNMASCCIAVDVLLRKLLLLLLLPKYRQTDWVGDSLTDFEIIFVVGV